MRYFTEWNAVQVFGRLTYCAYLIHVTLLKIRLGKVRSPIYVTEYLLVRLLIITNIFIVLVKHKHHYIISYYIILST